MSEMQDTVTHICSEGKGILASDESTGTIGKRFAKYGLPNDEETRRSYRELLFTANVGEYLSGAILYKETLYQSASDGTLFVDCLKRRGILPGIKVDEGLLEIVGLNGETETKGLATLAENLARYKEQGALFTKWRAALKIGNGCPSDKAIQINAEQLAEYAALSQACGLVPIVEPEVLVDGTQTIEAVRTASEKVLSACMTELWKRPVVLEYCLLKPQMITGTTSMSGDRSQIIAVESIRTFQRFVPPAIPGIMFLSGGQTEAEATLNLAQINRLARETTKAPWRLSFSFGRALQASVLKVWSEDQQNREAAQKKAEQLAKVNSDASKGILCETHPSVLSDIQNLNESFRGRYSSA